MQRTNRPLAVTSVVLLAAFLGAGWYTRSVSRAVRQKREQMQRLEEEVTHGPRLAPALEGVQEQRDWRAAIWADDVQRVEGYLRHGFTVNRGVAGQTPLCLAAQKGALRVGALLLARGADVNGPDNNGKGPLLYAVEGKHVAFATLLLAHGAKVDAVPVMKANATGGVGFVSGGPEAWACAYGAPLDCAAATGDEELGRLLLAHGAKANRPEGYSVALNQAVIAGKLAMAELLLAHGARVNRPPGARPESDCPLRDAIMAGNAAMVKLLLAHGADCGQPVWDGRTVFPSMLQFARREKNDEIVQLLQQAEAGRARR